MNSSIVLIKTLDLYPLAILEDIAYFLHFLYTYEKSLSNQAQFCLIKRQW